MVREEKAQIGPVDNITSEGHPDPETVDRRPGTFLEQDDDFAASDLRNPGNSTASPSGEHNVTVTSHQEDHSKPAVMINGNSIDDISQDDDEPLELYTTPGGVIVDKDLITVRLSLNGMWETPSRKWTFPIKACHVWKDMHQLMVDALKKDPWVFPLIEQSKFQIICGGAIILPQTWESVCKPGIEVVLELEAFRPPTFATSPYGPETQDNSEESSSDSSDDELDNNSDNLKPIPQDSMDNEVLSPSGTERALSPTRKAIYDSTVKYTVKYYESEKEAGYDHKTFLFEQSFETPMVFEHEKRKKGSKIAVLEEITTIIRQRTTAVDYKRGRRAVPPPRMPYDPYGMSPYGDPYGYSAYDPYAPAPVGTSQISAKISSKRPVMKADDAIDSKAVIINSPCLMNALRAVVTTSTAANDEVHVSYESRNIKAYNDPLMTGNFPLPYKELYHNREKLKEYKTSEYLRSRHSNHWVEETAHHIDLLLDFLENQGDVRLKKAEELWAQAHPQTTFEFLWLHFKPGSDVYALENGCYSAYVVDSVVGGPKYVGKSRILGSYSLTAWYLAYDGYSIRRQAKSFYIPIFDGEREIKSLPVFPCNFYKEEINKPTLREQLTARGIIYLDLMRGPAFREYSGFGKLKEKRLYDRARVVVVPRKPPSRSRLDPGRRRDYDSDDSAEEDFNMVAYDPINKYGIKIGACDRVPGCQCEKCKVYNLDNQIFDRLPFVTYDDINPTGDDPLTPHQYFLCESHVHAFVLKDRKYDVEDSIEVALLKTPKFNTHAIDRLVMKSSINKSVIKALCKAYATPDAHHKTFYADDIQGKGEGQIILLHGPPGTGKTLTAESVAEFTRRPLLNITAADLGHGPAQVDRRLNKYFNLATLWGAVVLMDEADIYLERRSADDLSRNSIVSIFLRTMDYFKGILFLTTNRVGKFDEAFMSRIHLQIGYDPLDDAARREIWDNNFKKLEEEQGKDTHPITFDYSAKEYVRRAQEVRELEWNGREIRNAFQTAVSLAIEEAESDKATPVLRESHLAKIVTMARAFKDYMRAVHQSDPSQLAFLDGLRNDDKKTHELLERGA